MFIGVARITLHIPGNNSLKGKRSVMRRVIERARAKFNAAVAEVSDNDQHRRGVVGVSVVGNDGRHVDSMLGGVIRFIEQIGVAPVLDIETEIIPMTKEIGMTGMDNEFGDDVWSDPGFQDGIDDEEEEEW